MSHPGRLAWSLWLAAIALSVSFLWLVMLSAGGPGPLEYYEEWGVTLVYVALAIAYPTLGAVVASRHPSNAIGWMFCVAGIAISGAGATQLYAEYTLYTDPGSLPAGDVAFWLSSWLFPLGLFITPIFLFLLFPTGRPSSRFWGHVLKVSVAFTILSFLSIMLTPGRIEPVGFGVENPFGLPGVAGEIVKGINRFGQMALPIVFLMSLAAFLARRRSAKGVERQQIKWFGYSTALTVTSFAASFTSVALGSQTGGDVAFIIGAIGLFSIPISSGLAILRYRLYDIDVVINRTLVYGALSAILAGIYIGLVFAFQSLLTPFTAESDLAIAGSTLAVAALFRPVRDRVQTFIDRRFYRKKFDAQRTLEDFSSHLRDEVELSSLSSRLTAVVSETMQPAHVSIWLRGKGATP